MSRFLKHTLRCVVFLAVLALLLTGVSQLVRPKNNTRSDGIHDPAANGILGEPDHTIDLLILGDSESYSAFIPMQLWQQYGYTAYCCGTSRQTLYYSEAFLHKAFQKQSPKLGKTKSCTIAWVCYCYHLPALVLISLAVM